MAQPRPASPLLLLELSAEVSGHLAVAIHMYRNRCTEQGQRFPAQLREIQESLAGRAMQGQQAPMIGDIPTISNAERMPPKALTYTQTAEVLGCSLRTIKRRVASGELPAVRARIRVTDIDEYLAGA